MVEKIIDRGIISLEANNVVIKREDWLKVSVRLLRPLYKSTVLCKCAIAPAIGRVPAPRNKARGGIRRKAHLCLADNNGGLAVSGMHDKPFVCDYRNPKFASHASHPAREFFAHWAACTSLQQLCLPLSAFAEAAVWECRKRRQQRRPILLWWPPARPLSRQSLGMGLRRRIARLPGRQMQRYIPCC